jgi:hypothetical protein
MTDYLLDAYAILSISTIYTIPTILAIFPCLAILTVFAIFTVTPIDAVFTIFAISTVFTINAITPISTVFAVLRLDGRHYLDFSDPAENVRYSLPSFRYG